VSTADVIEHRTGEARLIMNKEAVLKGEEC
jgi:hypothetical protein